MGDGIAHGEIRNTRLHDNRTIFEIDFSNAAELGHAEENAIGERQCAAGQRRPGAARNHLDTFVMAIAQDLGDLQGCLGQHHDHGELPIGGQAIGLVRSHFRLVGNYALAADNGPQGGDYAASAVQTARSGSGMRTDIPSAPIFDPNEDISHLTPYT